MCISQLRRDLMQGNKSLFHTTPGRLTTRSRLRLRIAKLKNKTCTINLIREGTASGRLSGTVRHGALVLAGLDVMEPAATCIHRSMEATPAFALAGPGGTLISRFAGDHGARPASLTIGCLWANPFLSTHGPNQRAIIGRPVPGLVS